MVRKKRWGVGLAVLLAVLSAFWVMPTVQAAGQQGSEFYISPLYPSNQTDTNIGYFVLKVKPGQRGKFGVQVQNTSKTDTRTIKLTPVTATTTNAGQMNYTPSTKKADPTLKYPLAGMMSKGVTVTLAPGEGKSVTFEYQVPAKGFKGQIAGSIYALDVTPVKAADKSEMLHNRFAMALGVLLSENPDKTLMPDLKLQQVRPGVENKTPVVFARVQNRAPQLFGKMTVNSRITAKGDSKTKFKKTLTNGSMAPNSNFDLPVPVNKDGIPAGDYTLYMTINAVGKTWHFKRNFTVSQQDANKLGATQPAKKLDWQKWLLWAAIALAVLIVAYGLYLLGVRRGHKHDEEEKHTDHSL
ncbi:DUF916 and DUF3324 domain-containing protein [Schleiferilactobacillus shenzhenensis]|nr:DUF916 and DUF3324 domain-containing protein [Schleiferilactobacillus shenzhenensis]